MNPRIIFLFTLSGACALTYQIVWIRYFTLEFGAMAPAVASVVAVFLGGLGLGAALAGRTFSGLRNPLRGYGLLEVGITLYALASPWLLGLALPALVSQVAAGVENPTALNGVRLLLAAFLLLPPTLLMGATLPLLARWAATHSTHDGYRAGRFYAWNTLGATAGAALAGLVLLPQLGMQNTLLLAGAVNGAIAALVLWMSRAAGALPAPALAKRPDTPAVATEDRVLTFLSVTLAAGAAMACQILWTRVASLVLGPSVYAFTVVLITFLAGLGLGAAAINRLIKTHQPRIRDIFNALLLLSAAAILATAHLIQHLPPWAIALQNLLNLEDSPQAEIYLQLALTALLILPGTFFFGGILPAAIQLVGQQGAEIGRDVGHLYAWDVVGSVAGTLLAGFLLLPLFGIAVSLTGTAVLFLGLLLLHQLLRSDGPAYTRGAVVFALMLGAWLVEPPYDRMLMTSGVHSYSSHYSEHTNLPDLREAVSKNRELLFYADGLTSSVTVVRAGPSHLNNLIAVDGKVEGSAYGDMPTQRLSAHLPILLHPAPERVGIVGLGTGSTAGSAALHPGVQVDVMEIEQAMVEGARYFFAVNHGVHDRDNVRIHETDARWYLRRSEGRFDVLSVQPSNPWVAGAGDLFTVDFFERGRRALAEGGIYAHWIQLYDMEPDDVRLLVRSFLEVFPDAVLATTIRGVDVLLIGFTDGARIDRERLRQGMAVEAIAADLARSPVGIQTPDDLLAHLRLGPDALRELAGRGPLNTDDRPILSYSAPRSRYLDTNRKNEALITRYADGVEPLLFDSGQPEAD